MKKPKNLEEFVKFNEYKFELVQEISQIKENCNRLRSQIRQRLKKDDVAMLKKELKDQLIRLDVVGDDYKLATGMFKDKMRYVGVVVDNAGIQHYTKSYTSLIGVLKSRNELQSKLAFGGDLKRSSPHFCRLACRDMAISKKRKLRGRNVRDDI